jgi:hypothetical protein
LENENVEQISKLEFEIRDLTKIRDSEMASEHELHLTEQNSELQAEIRALKSVTDRKLQLALRDRQQLESRLQEENDVLYRQLVD